MENNSLTGLSYLEGGIYHTLCNFASIDRYLEKLSDHFSPLPFRKKEVIEKINELVEKYNESNFNEINDKLATWICIKDDLLKIKEALKSAEVENPFEMFNKYYEKYCQIIEREFGYFERPLVQIVDRFPSPYDTMDWIAFAPDKEDEETYGIKNGIYFKKDYIAPYYTGYLMAHELTHKVIELRDPYAFGLGIEEGIAELYGVYLSSQAMPSDIVRNIVIYNWKFEPKNKINRLYDYFITLVYYRIYRPFGMEGIKSLIEMGRSKIKEFEKKLLKGENVELPKGGWNKNVDKIFEFYTLFISDQYVSPLAKYISKIVEKGKSLEEISRESKVKKELVEKALKELKEDVVAVMYDEEINYLDSFRLGLLRYEI